MKLMNICALIALSSLVSMASYGMYAIIDKVCTADAQKARLACVQSMGEDAQCQREAEEAKKRCSMEFLRGKRKLTGRE